MNQIKFRVWNGERMLYPEFFGSNAFGSKGIITIGWTNQGYIDLGVIRKEPYEARGSCTLMQFTGLLDKDGIEVYEGDILEVTSDNDGQKYITTFVCRLYYGISFHNSRLTLDMGLYDYSVHSHNCKVIGNIYEHPNLLTDR